MSDHILILFELKNDGYPKIISHYLMANSEWDKIKKNFDDDFEFLLEDESHFSEKIIITSDNLRVIENNNAKHIEAFRTLYKNSFYNYDLLSFFINEINKPKELKKSDSIFEMDDNDSDLGYYLKKKKNTPEFSSIDDERIKKLIMETKKTVKLFKNNGDN